MHRKAIKNEGLLKSTYQHYSQYGGHHDRLVPSICFRDPWPLDEEQVLKTVESVNTRTTSYGPGPTVRLLTSAAKFPRAISKDTIDKSFDLNNFDNGVWKN